MLVHTARVLRGEPAGSFTGAPWSDAYVYNTIEAACLALALDPEGDERLVQAQELLRRKLDEWIPIVLAAHGLVTGGAVTVRARADLESPRLGLLRAGSRVRADREGPGLAGAARHARRRRPRR